MLVISADTAFTYRGKSAAARQIGRELQVRPRIAALSQPVNRFALLLVPQASDVQSVHLSDRIAGAGRGTGRYDAVDFREIVCR